MMLQERYSMALRSLHWLTLILVIAAFASIELRELFEKGTDMRNGAKWIHFQFGALIFITTLARIVFKLQNPGPEMLTVAKWQAIAAKATMAGLYICLLSMPILGMVIVGYEQKDLSILGINMLDLGLTKDKVFAHQIEEIHETLGNLFLFLIVIHTAAAIWHHKILKDNTMMKMSFKP
jgi:cytochrome b561